MVRLHEVMVDTFLGSFDVPPEQIILDYEATDDRVHGEQVLRHFNRHYDDYCFLPPYALCGDQLLVSYLHPSSKGAAHHAPAVTKLMVEKLRTRWLDVRIILRGDVGYSVPKLPKNKVLQRLLADEMTQACLGYSLARQKHVRYTWFRYRTGRSWDRHR